MNPTSTKQIHALYDFFMRLNTQTKDDFYIAEDLAIETKKTMTVNNKKSLETLGRIIKEQTFDYETQKKANFVMRILFNQTNFIDPNLGILCSLNNIRQIINGCQHSERESWKGTLDKYLALYLEVTPQESSPLLKAVSSLDELIKVKFLHELQTNVELPEEVWLDIFSYLDMKDLVSLQLVCKTFSRIAQDPFVQRHALSRQYGISFGKISDQFFKEHKFLQHQILSFQKIPIIHLTDRNSYTSNDIQIGKTYVTLKNDSDIITFNINKNFENYTWKKKPKLLSIDDDTLYILEENGKIFKTTLDNSEIPFDYELIFDIGRNNIYPWHSLIISGDFIYLLSENQIAIINQSKKILEETLRFKEVYNLLHKGGKGGWILSFDKEGKSSVNIHLPHHLQSELPHSYSYIPKLIEGNTVYAVSRVFSCVRIFDLESRKVLQSFQYKDLEGKYDPLIAHANGFVFLAEYNKIFIWDLIEKKHLRTIEVKGYITDIKASGSNLYVATWYSFFCIDFSKKNESSSLCMSIINVFTNLFGGSEWKA